MPDSHVQSASFADFCRHASQSPLDPSVSKRYLSRQQFAEGGSILLLTLPQRGKNRETCALSHVEDDHGTRRDFLYVATASAGVVTAGAAVWPLVNQMNPSKDVLALSTVQIDVSGVEPGTQIKQIWQGKPVFVRRRTPEEIEQARSVPLADLPDQDARNNNLPAGAPATDQDRTLDEAGEWLVMVGVCTHLGCIPIGNAGDFGGWFCPCHGSHYDIAGRIRRGPAPENLRVPVAKFVSDTVIEIG
jgi:ubiquinol-cytochrome c reductase iron-sulfur subunit